MISRNPCFNHSIKGLQSTAMASATSSVRPTYFLTTPIFYPNGLPHIGHAYTAMVTDAIARFQRLDGFDVLFLTGTDEHGLKMQQTAIAEGLTPLQLADRNSARFRDMMAALNISYDDYIRTTEPRHERACQALWMAIERNGDIYLDKYAGWYSVRQEGYFDESETILGDDGIRREPLGSPVEWTEEESYFFRLSAYQDKLLDLYEGVPDFVLPRERLNEVASFVKSGLQDISVSRTTFDWGIKVPGAPGHVMYVWMDALTNYITAVGYPDVESESFKRYWPANLHVTGKDIVRFHAVYWPAFLMSAGVAVPQRLFSHGFLLNRGEKMSKSVGNVVDPFAMAGQYGVDQVRYFFMREVSFGQDGSYKHEAIVARTNADLANDLGNLAQRSLSMIAKQCDAVLPVPGDFSDNDKAILAQADGMLELARAAMSTQQIHQWLNAVWAVVAEANRYFAGEAPWALAKTDPPRQRTVLYVTAEVIRQIAILAQPVMPESSAKLLDSLGISGDQRSFAALGGATRIRPGITLPPPTPVFPRYIEPTAA
jgi:methionyl-tRNA synthetase